MHPRLMLRGLRLTQTNLPGSDLPLRPPRGLGQRIPRASRPAASGRCRCRGYPPRLTCMAREKKTPASDASFFTLNSMAGRKPPRRAPAVTAPLLHRFL